MPWWESAQLAADVTLLLLALVIWRKRVAVAQRVLDEPLPGVKPSDYRVVSMKPHKVYYAGPSLKEAKRIRARERGNGVHAVLKVNGENRN
ncbi:MAG: hypothetical protein ACPHK6_09580 [Ilumatobacteraceae bacterium]|jgi:hypothetical protein